jgi:methylthioribose-1-phosphate isomerase
MQVAGRPYRSIWLDEDGWAVRIIDQTVLPHQFRILRLETLEEAAHAISDMQVRGAPLIGATAAYGLALALREGADDQRLERAAKTLMATRPTAVNLRWALERALDLLRPLPTQARAAAAYELAAEVCEEDVAVNRAIGEQGLRLIRIAQERKKDPSEPVQVLTHCNAGWLATVDHGTALSPIYAAKRAGIPVHVWVDETRPRNQGASLTAWELGQEEIEHSVIADNTGGHLMQRGLVDLCITGTDRTTATGDVCNKIGTYLKALAAHDNGIPFYVALPGSTIDWTLAEGAAIPIEERGAEEVSRIAGRLEDGRLASVDLLPQGSRAVNYAFDVTPARLVSALITERGVCPATREGLLGLFPERREEAAGA